MQHVRFRDIHEARRLSPRQSEVLALAQLRRSDEEIGAILGIAPATVASHLLAARGALGLKTRRELVEWPHLRTRLPPQR